MYQYLTGKIVSKKKDKLILDVGGIGYEIFISGQTYKRIPSHNKTYQVHVYPHYREDNHKLFGFATEEEKYFFKVILGVNGIGPKVALSILSTFSIDQLKRVLLSEDSDSLILVPGLGKKGAQRLFIELQDKCKISEDDLSTSFNKNHPLEKDIIHALIALGYKEKQAHQSFLNVQKKWKNEKWIFENVMKACLFEISI